MMSNNTRKTYMQTLSDYKATYKALLKTRRKDDNYYYMREPFASLDALTIRAAVLLTYNLDPMDKPDTIADMKQMREEAEAESRKR